MEDIIGMEDMRLVFQVTDALGIDREQVRVSLEKEDPGLVRGVGAGEAGDVFAWTAPLVEITVPQTIPLEEWIPVLRSELEALGFQEVDVEDEEDVE